MFSKELKKLDDNTVQYMIDEMQDMIDKQSEQLADKDGIIDKQSEQLANQEEVISKQAEQLVDRDAIIDKQAAELEKLKRHIAELER